jgi:uncharacterized protein (DUF849 family)
MMMLKIALNGARPKSENQFIPQSLDEIEDQVSQIYHIGYKIFHIHCYDKNGNESLKPEDINNLVSRIRNISLEIKIGISTGDWIEPNFKKRINYIKEWDFVPDFASVNIIETHALDISEALIKKGIFIEAGLNEKRAAEIFIRSGIEKDCCRVLIEPEEESLPKAINTIIEIEDILNSGNISINKLLHGFNSVSWDLLREAKKRGYDSRMGMEDTIYLENGKKVRNNLELIYEADKLLNAT